MNSGVINMAGRLEVICGPMFSGKTEELIRRLRRLEIAGRTVQGIKPVVDTRSAAITSHAGSSISSINVADPWMLEELAKHIGVIGIDEVQFFDPKVLEYIMLVVERDKKIVIVSGLDMTYRKEPFGIMPELMARADSVLKLSAVCHICGNDAMYTQRLVDDKPAPFEGETVQIGGLDTYEARCRNCFEAA